jgi:deoxyhypusine synthase
MGMGEKSQSLAEKQGAREEEVREEVSGRGFMETGRVEEWIESYRLVGFQGTHLHRGIEEVRRMRESGSKIFLGYTSNLVSSGLRDLICYLVKNKYVDVLVSTAGGVEEDLIKTMKPSLLGTFDLGGEALRDSGLNRVGNILIPNENYFAFERWLKQILKRVVEGGYREEGVHMCGDRAVVTPSRLIRILGREVGSEESIYHWAYKNEIPVYCPALTDGSIGDIITYFGERERLVIDIVEDISRVNSEGLFVEKTGAIVLGTGIVKHHILNANLFRGGLDYCVLINTAQEYDGSDAGARIEESVSWGKVKSRTSSVKVHCDATIAFPLLVSAVWPMSGAGQGNKETSA